MVTIDEIRKSDKSVLTPTDIAPVLGCHPYAINVQAKADASKLGFSVCMIGSRVKVPRAAFLRWYDGLREDTA